MMASIAGCICIQRQRCCELGMAGMWDLHGSAQSVAIATISEALIIAGDGVDDAAPTKFENSHSHSDMDTPSIEPYHPSHRGYRHCCVSHQSTTHVYKYRQRLHVNVKQELLLTYCDVPDWSGV